MKRRNFVHKTAVGMAGFNLVSPGLQSLSFFRSSCVDEWLEKLITAASVKRMSSFNSMPKGLRALMNTTNQVFSKRGYHSTNPALFFYNQPDTYCFSVLELNHPNAGVNDMALPVFHQKANGDWIHLTTINGYQLEGLAKASEALTGHDEALQHILLPAVKKQDNNHYNGFSSHAGGIDFLTRISGNKEAETTICISTSNGIIFNDTFVSKHSLTCSPVNA